MSEKGDGFLLGRMHFTGDDVYQNFLVFSPMFNSLKLDNNKKVNNWISTGLLHEKIKTFDTNLEQNLSNLVNSRVTLKIKNSALVQKKFFPMHSNFILYLYKVYELNSWPRIPTNSFPQKICLFGEVKLVKKSIKCIIYL